MVSNIRFGKLGRCILLASVVITSQAFGGYVYDLSHKMMGGKKGDSSNTKIMVEGSKIKFSGFGTSSEMIFDGSNQTMLLVDHGKKSFLKMDQESISALTEKLDSAMAEMEQQLANVPPAQRKMMERMMKGKMPAAAEIPEVSIDRTGEKDTISGFDVEKVMVSSSDGTEQELWVAPWSSIKGSDKVVDAFNGMSNFYDQLMGSFSQGPLASFVGGGKGKKKGQSTGKNWLGELSKLEGFPVASKTFDKAGKLVSETLLSAVDEEDFGAEVFQAPKGYKEQKLEM